MAENDFNNSRQVQEEDVNSDSPSGSSSEHSTTDASEDNSQNTTDLDIKRAPLSRASTLESIQEEDSELEERYMLDSFKSITDVFENGYSEEEKMSSEKSSPAASSLTSKSASLSISEDTDSLDEEVRQIMSRSEDKRLQSQEATNQVAINSLKNADVNDETKITKDEEEKKSYNEKLKEEEEDEEEEEILDDYEDIGVEWDQASSVPTDTESLSDSEPDSELESLLSEDEKTGHWAPRKGSDSSDDDEFDLEEHISKLCSHTLYSDSSSEFEGSDSEAEKQKAIKKVMKMYSKKYAQDKESETESYDDDDSDVEETDLDDNASDDGWDEIEEVEVKDDDDDSSDYSTSDDDTDSDFLDDDSASISTESSVSGDYEVDRDKDTVQAVNEEIPYLSDPAMPSHEVVFKYYLGNRPESCPEKIEVQDGDLNNNIALDNTLATRSVINLRWPFTSYYVKEFDLDSEDPTYEEDGLLPCYKSMKSSASFPGRRRDVMLGRVWWVEWWAKDVVNDEEEEEEEEEGEDVHNNNPEKKKEDLEDVEEMGQFEREKLDTQL